MDDKNRQRLINNALNRCVHFNGVINPKCDAGVTYAEVQDNSQGAPFMHPCWKTDHWEKGRVCVTSCEKVSFPTQAEAEAHVDKIEASINQWAADLNGNICPTHKTPMTKRQIGKCVYAEPCGCRLYQGTLKKTA